jgi:hypothetical protein
MPAKPTFQESYMAHRIEQCCDCTPDNTSLDRRRFLQTTAAGVAVASSGLVLPGFARGEDKPAKVESETLVKQLYDSLNEEQQKKICYSFDHELRSEVNNNWYINDSRVGTDFNKDQQRLILDIFRGLHSDEYVDKVAKQVETDGNGKDLSRCAVAMFGKPGDKFEFVITGRHVTRRCDGNSVEGAAFGGPIFYGHAAQGFNEKPDHPGNIYWYQAQRANELFNALDGKQRDKALLTESRAEEGSDTVKLSGKTSDLVGLAVAELTSDQKDLMRKVMSDLLMPFREVDREESMKLVEKSGFDNLHLSFNKGMDVGEDGVWDVWTVEGPNMIWYFRGDPHVHTWVHIRDSA